MPRTTVASVQAQLEQSNISYEKLAADNASLQSTLAAFAAKLEALTAPQTPVAPVPPAPPAPAAVAGVKRYQCNSCGGTGLRAWNGQLNNCPSCEQVDGKATGKQTPADIQRTRNYWELQARDAEAARRAKVANILAVAKLQQAQHAPA